MAEPMMVDEPVMVDDEMRARKGKGVATDPKDSIDSSPWVNMTRAC
jgi:hypothetical protein